MDRLKDNILTAYGVSDPAPYYQAADLAMLLSEGEGLSNFLLEAMASGLPTITTAAAALPDSRGEQTGAYIIPNTPAMKKTALEYLLKLEKEPSNLAEMGKRARRHIESTYSLDRAGQSYLSLYQGMIRHDDRRP